MSEKAQKRKGRVRLERKSEKANVKLQRADLAAARGGSLAPGLTAPALATSLPSPVLSS